MKVSPVSFCGVYRATTVNTSNISSQQIQNEIELSKDARNLGIDVPNYEITYGESKNPISIFYETKGEPANHRNNPITEKHLGNLFKDLFLLDKRGINHNDLDMAHCFYSEDGNVEFDCFRFGHYFAKSPNPNYNLPSFEFPNNQTNYEKASIAQYVASMSNNQERMDFAKTYLQSSTDYHAKRADFISSNLNKTNDRGITCTPEMLETELVQASILQTPDDDTSRLFLHKMDFLLKDRSAFTEWDEGNGACGHPFSKERRINSIPMYLEAVKSAITYTQEAEALRDKSTGIRAKYFDIEAQRGDYYSNTYISWIEGMANWNFEDTKMRKEPPKELPQIKESYQQIKNAKDNSSRITAIDNYIELYKKHTTI